MAFISEKVNINVERQNETILTSLHDRELQMTTNSSDIGNCYRLLPCMAEILAIQICEFPPNKNTWVNTHIYIYITEHAFTF